jgi:hypothetical protein
MGRFDALTQIEEAPVKPTPSPDVPSTKPRRKKTDLLANQQTTKDVSTHTPPQAPQATGQATNPPLSPSARSEHTLDTSLLTTKEKTKYGTYLTDESIEKISIRAIHLKRDAHQIVQEAVNQYFEKQEK